MNESFAGTQVRCLKCQSVSVVPLTEQQLAAQAAAAAQQRAAEWDARKAAIVISTGAIDRPHAILQIVFAAAVRKFGGRGLFAQDASDINNATYNQMIEQVYVTAVDIFRDKAVRVGADAVIHAKFDIEQIVMYERGLVDGNALRMQVFCTGTAVKFT